VLKLRLGGGQFAGGYGVCKTAAFVGPVTERLVGGVPAAAEANSGTAREAKSASLGIDNLEVPFYANRTIVVHDDLGCRHLFSRGKIAK
jgi:hypothetical protein